jgi:hypothetical protein
MVFLIQNTQNLDSEAVQLKLDELIRAIEGAHNALLDWNSWKRKSSTASVPSTRDWRNAPEQIYGGEVSIPVSLPWTKMERPDEHLPNTGWNRHYYHRRWSRFGPACCFLNSFDGESIWTRKNSP